MRRRCVAATAVALRRLGAVLTFCAQQRLYSVLETRLEGRDWLVGDGKGKISLGE